MEKLFPNSSMQLHAALPPRPPNINKPSALSVWDFRTSQVSSRPASRHWKCIFLENVRHLLLKSHLFLFEFALSWLNTIVVQAWTSIFTLMGYIPISVIQQIIMINLQQFSWNNLSRELSRAHVLHSLPSFRWRRSECYHFSNQIKWVI